MKVLDVERPLPLAGLQALLLIGCGLIIAWLIVYASPLIAVVAFLGVTFVTVFLRRPDLGLLFVLFIRSCTDVFAGTGAGLYGSFASRLAETPNVGLIVVVTLGGALFIISHRVRFLRLPAALPLVFLLATGAVGTLRAPAIVAAMDRWIAILSALIVYALVTALFREPRRIQKVIDIIMVSFIVPALVGFYQLATGQTDYDIMEHVSRVRATFVHPAAFGDYLVIMFGVFLCQTLAQRGVRKGVSLVFLVTSALLLSLSLARNSLVGALIIFLIVGALRSRTLLLLAPLVVVIALLAVPSVGTRFADPMGGSFEDRQELWQSAYHEWLGVTSNDQSSFATFVNRLAGTGPGSVGFLTAPSRGFPYFAHNDYLGVLLEYGVLGLIAFIVYTISLIVMAYRTWRQTIDPPMKAVALSFLAIAVAYAVMYFTDNIFGRTENQLYFWTLAGLSAAIAQMNRRPQQSPSPARVGGRQRVPV